MADLFQKPLPAEYQGLSAEQAAAGIAARKQALGEKMVILGHHYQSDEIIQFADLIGDSLKLSQLAAEQDKARFVVFCGVHFMAESADILTAPEVAVLLPNLTAGCAMADMADIDDLEEAWAYLTSVTDERIVPITYVNSTASIKAFCGRHDGACCTSGNADKVLKWAFGRADKVLFVPDQHLGRNTAYALGTPLEAMATWNPQANHGSLSDDQIRSARVILWQGHCYVHQLITEQHCDEARQADPECKIIVHPECPWEVVQKADMSGSTERILKVLADAPDGSHWAIGTEIHMVERAARAYAGRKVIRPLGGRHCTCTTMARITLPYLLWTLDDLAAGRLSNRITVDEATAREARIALQRMLDNV